MSQRLAALVGMVAKAYGITEESLISGGRDKFEAEARGLVMWLATEAWGLQVCVVARSMGKHVRTVRHARRRIAALRWADATFREQTDAMFAKLKAHEAKLRAQIRGHNSESHEGVPFTLSV